MADSNDTPVILQQLGNIQGQLKGLAEYMAARDRHVDERLEGHTTRLNAHSKDIQANAKKITWLYGGLAGVTTTAGAIWAIAKTYFSTGGHA